ncbi:Hypothetical predicted protein, partial [Marmota monax]
SRRTRLVNTPRRGDLHLCDPGALQLAGGPKADAHSHSHRHQLAPGALRHGASRLRLSRPNHLWALGARPAAGHAPCRPCWGRL